MKKICVMLVIAICLGLFGCKKSPPREPKPTRRAVEQNQPAAPAPAVEKTAAEAQKATPETAPKAAEITKPAVAEVNQALSTTPAEIDLTSPIDTLKAKAKQMSIDALKATAEKYKAQILSTNSALTAKTDLLAKIPATEKLGAEAQALTKEIQALTSSLAALKERMMVYVDALKAQGVDVSSFKL